MKRWLIFSLFIGLCAIYAQEADSSSDHLITLADELEAAIGEDDPDGVFTLEDFIHEGEDDDEMEEEESEQFTPEEFDVIQGLSDHSETPVDLGLQEEMADVIAEEKAAAPAKDSTMLSEDEAEEEMEEDDDIIVGFAQEPIKESEEATISPEDLDFDVEKKEERVINLVERAVRELQDEPLDVACNRFSHTKEFIYGDLYIFIYDTSGICFAHGDDMQLIWRNLYDLTDWVGTPLVQEIIKKAKIGGGWVTYGWHNATKISYVQLVEKEGKSYIVGCGYFPHSKQEAVINLVKGGVALFTHGKKAGHSVDFTFSRLSYPRGRFIVGNLYLYALDFKGNIVVQGERPGLIGRNAWDYQDENGLYVNQEIIKKLKTATDEGVWVKYISKRAEKMAYAEKVTAKDGKEYFIAAGYYPEADRERTVDLVRKGYQFMKIHGKTNASEKFSHRRTDDFRYGDLYLIVYDMKGRIIADGGNADNIGRNVLNTRDEDGFEYIKSMLRRATKEGIWVNAKISGSFQATYAQKIDIGVGQYVIAASYYPVSKPETMVLLVESAVSFLKSNPREKAFEEFVKQSGKFRRGDLEIVAVDTSGLCYAYGDDFDLIWRNIFDIKDEKGRPFIKMFINQAQLGNTIVKTSMNNATKFNYVASVQKEGKAYVVSSGYYK